MNFSKMKPHLLMLEGNIGVGKSTFLHLIKKLLPTLSIVPEPTQQWQAVGLDGNLLDLFYKDTSRWAYTFQTYAFLTRMQLFQEFVSAHAFTNTPILFERSVYCDRYCFAKNCFEMGNMTALEWHLYTEWFSWLVNSSRTIKPHGFIYLRAQAETCYERLKKRNRHEEETISLLYLQSLHHKHEQWLIEQKTVEQSIANVPVLILDCDQDFENNKEIQKDFAEKIQAFINTSSSTPAYFADKDYELSLKA